jgi:hypothetical protein
MNPHQDWNRAELNDHLQQITTIVWNLAKQYDGNSEAILYCLRTLEQLHRQIRTEMFEPALPNTRKDLYHLLRDIEETGGWPYIERMKLKTLLTYLESDLAPETTPTIEVGENPG